MFSLKNWKKEILTIPNLLSVFRIALIPVYLHIYLNADSPDDYTTAAVILAVLVAWPRRLTLILTGAAVSAVMAGIVAAGGGIHHLLSFVGAQGARGMQMEAPFTTPGLWQAILGGSNAYIFEDKLINTREVRGAMGEPVAALMMPLLAAAALAVVLLLIWALRRGADAGQLLIAGSSYYRSSLIDRRLWDASFLVS